MERMMNPSSTAGGYDQTTPLQKKLLVGIATVSSAAMFLWSAYVLITKFKHDADFVIAAVMLVLVVGYMAYTVFMDFNSAHDRVQDIFVLGMLAFGAMAMAVPNLESGWSWWQAAGFRGTIMMTPLTAVLILCGRMFIRGAMANAQLITQLQREIAQAQNGSPTGSEMPDNEFDEVLEDLEVEIEPQADNFSEPSPPRKSKSEPEDEVEWEDGTMGDVQAKDAIMLGNQILVCVSVGAPTAQGRTYIWQELDENFDPIGERFKQAFNNGVKVKFALLPQEA